MRLALSILVATSVACTGSAGQQGSSGPQGPQGPQGPAGPQGDAGPRGGGLYTSRSQITCKGIQGLFVADGGVVAVGGGATATMTVRCDDEHDLPLAGSCEGTWPSDTTLGVNEPDSWMATEVDLDAGVFPAGWLCTWGVTAGSHDLPNVQGRMCCIQNH
jgi:hypothetical protein